MIALLLFSMLLIAMPMVHGIDKSPKAVEKWFKNLSHKKEKLAKLHFYFHDTVTGKSPTAYQVAQSNITAISPTFFGLVRVIDDPLTVGPEINSTLIGRAQGFFASASLLDEPGLAMTVNLVFTNGKYNGSSLSLLGRNAILSEYREMSIVGGSGIFRLARGIATAQTYLFNLTTGDAVVEYNVIVMHY